MKWRSNPVSQTALPSVLTRTFTLPPTIFKPRLAAENLTEMRTNEHKFAGFIFLTFELFGSAHNFLESCLLTAEVVAKIYS